jgi:hypothetical protein
MAMAAPVPEAPLRGSRGWPGQARQARRSFGPRGRRGQRRAAVPGAQQGARSHPSPGDVPHGHARLGAPIPGPLSGHRSLTQKGPGAQGQEEPRPSRGQAGPGACFRPRQGTGQAGPGSPGQVAAHPAGRALLPGGAHWEASGAAAPTARAGIAATGRSRWGGGRDEAVMAAEEEPGVWGHLLAGRTERRAAAGPETLVLKESEWMEGPPTLGRGGEGDVVTM